MAQQQNSGDYGPNSPEKPGYSFVVRILQKEDSSMKGQQLSGADIAPLCTRYVASRQVKRGRTPWMLDQLQLSKSGLDSFWRMQLWRPLPPSDPD
jgi:hypothetical protein